MKGTPISILLFFLVFNCTGFSQTPVKISKPRLELEANNINIFYDILNSSLTDKFIIWIEITDSTGNFINAKTLVGDIGDSIIGGDNKKITWDLTADGIYIDAGIFVQVHAEAIMPAGTDEIIQPVKNIKRGGAIIQSVIFPGLGLSRINRGKPHWLKGVAGYGCIAGSVIYNKKAVASFDSYLNASDLIDIDNFYDKSVKEDNLSEYLAYAAIGVWAIDIIWTIAGSSKLNSGLNKSQEKSFSINPDYEPLVNAPMVTFTYKF